METLKQKFIRYAVSTAITFFTAFGLAFLLSLQHVLEGNQPLDSALFFSLLSGAALAGVRAIIKLLVERLQKTIKHEE